MDPDAALARLRALTSRIHSIDATTDEGSLSAATDRSAVAIELADTFDGLDRWLASGGFQPAAWRG